MKRNGRKSTNVHIQTPKEHKAAVAGLKFDTQQKKNSRAINEGEPIAWAEKKNSDIMMGALNNPGRKKNFNKRVMSDPAPGSFTQGNDNYTEVKNIEKDYPFFKHTTKGK